MASDEDQPTEAQESTDRAARTEDVVRAVMSFWAIGGGTLFILFFDGWLINGIPAPWLGYVLIAVGLLALMGFNVFRGGPLDKRHDRPSTPPRDAA